MYIMTGENEKVCGGIKKGFVPKNGLTESRVRACISVSGEEKAALEAMMSFVSG